MRSSQQSPEGPGVEVLYQAVGNFRRNVINGRDAQCQAMQVGTSRLVMKPLKDKAVVCIGPFPERALEDREEFIRR